MEHEEIRNAAQEYAKRIYGDSIHNARKIITEGFIEGAKWALKHQWIDVDDRLPENGEYVFVVNYDNAYAAWYNEKTGTFYDDYGFSVVPTHWMEIPECL